MSSSRKRRNGWRTTGILLAIIGLLAVILEFTPTSDYVVLPGVTENLNRIVTVAGHHPPARGKMLMVAVDVQQASLFQRIYAVLTPYAELIPASEMIPPGGNFRQYEQAAQAQMNESHLAAEVAALRLVGYRNAREEGQGALVVGTYRAAPAAKVLKPGDVIVDFNGRPISLASELVNATHAVSFGSTVRLTVKRKGKILHLNVKTIRDPAISASPIIGVFVQSVGVHFVVPLKIRIATGNISGPSAGTMFALSIINQLKPSWDLTHGTTVAGTGTINADGQVGAIGGVREKVVTVFRAGAKLFLVPRGNYAAAVHQAKITGIAPHMRIVPISSLAGAVAALRRGAVHAG